MKLYLGAATSQVFWRIVYPGTRVPGWPGTAFDGGQCAVNAGDVSRYLPDWVDALKCFNLKKPDVLTFDADQRRRGGFHVVKIWSSDVPEGSFYNLGNDVCVSSPAFTFLQMARMLSLPELIAYGDELCGTYSFSPLSKRGMVQRNKPLVRLDALSCYLEGARGCPGAKQARKALPFIVEGSASPMETVDEMLLCLPYRLGGYGLPVPDMNLEIPLDERAAAIAGKKSCRGDICWPAINLVIEHQGLYDHDEAGSFEADRARVNALKAQGLDVLELTTSMVHDRRAFEEIALFAAEKLNKRVRKEHRGALPQRIALRACLFAWNRRYGIPL